ncbi:MAG: site-specific DNA-methyltransferase [Actinobacteria bacterium HGW-Actinobacteria-1]|jgi:site-specific DNA-methyltransferase (adenine-specific)|nr:MAG: site-specific DNA-methyltransferase [Actinobacteria bacterium HGW-Actinobacteria-1]
MANKYTIEPYHQGEGYVLYLGDVLEVLRAIPAESVDMAFADPPYLLSNGGVTCKSGKFAAVNKGDWDESNGFEQDYRWHRSWLKAVRRVLKPNGTLWVSGTSHNIYLIGHAMQSLEYKILNDIAWLKPNAPPNLSCRYFTHSHETLLWAARSRASKHTFNYELMKAENAGRQMRSYWSFTPPKAAEKLQGKHPTQKPVALLERIVLATTLPGDHILDPFAGSGTTGVAAVSQSRAFIGVDECPSYLDIASRRLDHVQCTLSIEN